MQDQRSRCRSLDYCMPFLISGMGCLSPGGHSLDSFRFRFAARCLRRSLAILALVSPALLLVIGERCALPVSATHRLRPPSHSVSRHWCPPCRAFPHDPPFPTLTVPSTYREHQPACTSSDCVSSKENKECSIRNVSENLRVDRFSGVSFYLQVHKRISIQK